MFDVAQGSYDGAEIAEVCGLFLLTEIQKELGNLELGLYRDDGLAAIKGSGPHIQKIQKQLIKIFQRNGLKLDKQPPISTRTDFLDIILDLKKNSYEPYTKPNQEILYVNRLSNHPKVIIN